jgi:hypothetical protein
MLPLRTLAIAAAALACVCLLWWSTAWRDEDRALWRTYSDATAGINIALSLAILAAAYVASGWQDRAGRLARVLAGFLSLAVILVLLEIPAALGYDYRRVLNGPGNENFNLAVQGVNRRDPELISVHQPHSRFRGSVTGNLVAKLGIPNPTRYQVDVRYDRNGFRNAVDLTNADIVAIGDSFVEGAETPEDQILTSVLAGRLGVTVANLGQSGYGPQEELAVLRRYGMALGPRVVLWFFYEGNDLDNVERYERIRKIAASPNVPPEPLRERLFVRNLLKAFAGVTTPPRRIAGPDAVRYRGLFKRADGLQETVYLNDSEGPPGPNLAGDGPPDPRLFEMAAGFLAQADRLARDGSARFLLINVPYKFRVYEGLLELKPDSPVRGWRTNNLPELLGQWCAARGMEFLDATTVLRAAAEKGESVYLADDTHWSPAGHRVVAEAIVERLRTVASEWRP